MRLNMDKQKEHGRVVEWKGKDWEDGWTERNRYVITGLCILLEVWDCPKIPRWVPEGKWAAGDDGTEERPRSRQQESGRPSSLGRHSSSCRTLKTSAAQTTTGMPPIRRPYSWNQCGFVSVRKLCFQEFLKKAWGVGEAWSGQDWSPCSHAGLQLKVMSYEHCEHKWLSAADQHTDTFRNTQLFLFPFLSFVSLLL